VKLNEVKYLEQVKRISLTLLLVALSRKASRILRPPYLRLLSRKAVLYLASTQGSPPFSPSAFQLIDMDTSTVVPTVPLSRISFAKLLAKDKGETERLFQACKNLGFFSLDLRSHPEGTQLLGVSDRLLALGEPFLICLRRSCCSTGCQESPCMGMLLALPSYSVLFIVGILNALVIL